MKLNFYSNSKLLFLLIAIFVANSVISQNVSYNTAQKLAERFFSDNNKSNKNEASLAFANVNQTDTLFYIFNNGNSGFIIVSGDYTVYPVLGYSNEGNFNTQQQNPSVMYWLDTYAKQIYDIKTNKKSRKVNSAWNKFLNYGFSKLSKSLNNGVFPFLSTRWSQSPWYNMYCPVNSSVGDGSGRCPTGCVATSMAQVMKYYNYPPHGYGSNSYIHPYYGTISADFSKDTYDWTNMPVALSAQSQTSQKSSIARLMYDCGVAVNMNYGPLGSSSSTFAAANAFVQNFKYRNTISNELRGSSKYNNFTWKNLLKDNIDLRHPVLYSGDDPLLGGHAWVCDGYQSDALDSMYFHFNWGWGGTSDGYFVLDNLNTENGTYTIGQAAIVNIAPYTAPYCMSKMVLKNTNDEISDGSGQSFYWAGTHCDWLIEPPDAKNIVLYFNNFSTVKGSDYVTVYDGDSTNAPILGSFSGYNIPPDLRSTTGKMLLSFNSTQQDSGWDVAYYIPFCSLKTILTKPTDTISDGSGKSTYWQHTSCDWLITPPGAKNIVLRFIHFKTFQGSDFVTIYDGDTTTAPMLGTFSGNTIPPVLSAMSGKMLIVFSSIKQGEGWDATYSINTAGINENVTSNNTQLYPNPVKDFVNITLPSEIYGNALINVFNITGQKVFSKQLTFNKSSNSVNLSALYPGMYILEIINNKASLKYKISKL